MRALAGLLGGVALFVAAAGAAQPRSSEARALSRWTSPVLTPFASEAELRNYLRDVARANAADDRAQRPGPLQFAAAAQDDVQADTAEPLCPADDPACFAEEGSIAVTGARVSNPPITNNQEAGVEEGDIVKQIGQFLLVLQDGRIFSIDTRPANGAGLALVDRVNVYRDPDEDTWYDEMLVAGDRVLITGYSYREEATELAVFRIDQAGRLTSQGVFFLSSNDYYDTENYATRVVGDRLIVYTPIDLADIDLDEKLEWPAVRRWQPEGSRATPARGRPLLGARDLYRPVRDTLEPFAHTISVCPLGTAGGGRDLACRTTGFVGPSDREFHVSPTDAFLWVNSWDNHPLPEASDTDCPAGYRPERGETLPALLFRLPLDGDAPGVLGVHGDPIDYLSLDSGGGRFRALVRWPSSRCDHDEPYPLTFFEVATGRIAGRLFEAPAHAYTPVPAVGPGSIENRFTDHYLVYGGRISWGSYPPDEPLAGPVQVAAVPLDRPADARVLAIPHSILRVEQAGDDAVVTGYRDDSGLDVSLIDLSAAPRVASTVRLPGRYETEGRSHAFNSLIEPDGSGLMGVPTTHRESQSGRWWSYSDASDVSFLATDSAGRLASLGELLAHANSPNRDDEHDAIDEDGRWEGYECEVSCIDWYGNSRPIFTDGRVFALSGTEIVEGSVERGRIREIRRLNLSAPPPSR